MKMASILVFIIVIIVFVYVTSDFWTWSFFDFKFLSLSISPFNKNLIKFSKPVEHIPIQSYQLMQGSKSYQQKSSLLHRDKISPGQLRIMIT